MSNPEAHEMAAELKRSSVGTNVCSHPTSACDWRLERLIDRLPRRFRSTVRWLRQPSSTWLRLPAGVVLSCAGVLGFLPVLGFWMLPVGPVLLADDVPPLRSLRSRILDRIERRHPRWLAASGHLPDAPA
jgi:hypothetical protein